MAPITACHHQLSVIVVVVAGNTQKVIIKVDNIFWCHATAAAAAVAVVAVVATKTFCRFLYLCTNF